jgi:hypothetical protein
MKYTYDCSRECQSTHKHCNRCGVLAGPEHLYKLRGGLCYEVFLIESYTTEDGEEGWNSIWTPAFNNCWDSKKKDRQLAKQGICVDCHRTAIKNQRCGRCYHKYMMATDELYEASFESLVRDREHLKEVA